MAFNTIEFFFFTLVIFMLYYLPFLKRYQILILTAAGFVFYAYINIYYCLLLIVSISCNLFVKRMIDIYGRSVWGKTWTAIGVCINIFILVFFKYSGLLAETFFNVGNDNWILLLPLPLGVSFYTFQGISLLVDSFRNHTEDIRDKNILDTICYLSFFPNSVSGPLIKHKYFISQIKEKRIQDIQFTNVFKFLLVGYFLKVCVADNLQNYTFGMQYPYFINRSPVELLLMMFAYSAQIFADFAGYSLIAKGIAGLLGYTLPDNFNFPYIAESFGEFWHRWHITLSNWLRDYIYIPFGGNRKGQIRTYFNLFLIMLIGGIWHGADWKFLLWGALHGSVLAVERYIKDKSKRKINNKITNMIKICLVFFTVSWLWLFFRLDSVNSVILYTKQMLTGWTNIFNADISLCLFCIFYSIPIAIYHILHKFSANSKANVWQAGKVVLYSIMVLALIFNRGTSEAFIYFQF